MKDLISVGIILVIIDVIYLSLVGGPPFVKMVEKIQGKNVKMNYISAIMAYVFLVAMAYIFIIKKKATNKEAFILGLLTYGIFDFTNMALFEKYDPIIALQDTIWGGTLYMLVNIVFNKIK